MDLNGELERRVYVLETANYTLSQELVRRGEVVSTNAVDTITQIKNDIKKYKSRVEGEGQNGPGGRRSPGKETAKRCRCGQHNPHTHQHKLGDLQSKIMAVKS